MSDNKLVLTPSTPLGPTPDRERLVTRLTSIGLIGEPFSVVDEPRFRAGPRLTSLVTFVRTHTVVSLVSSPRGLVEAGRGPSPDFCTVGVPEPTADIEFLGSALTDGFSCPRCGTAVEEWPDVVSEWYEAKTTYLFKCARCASAIPIWSLDWHHNNGFGRVSVEIWGVHQGEATPNPALLEALESLTGTHWTYFHFRL